MPRRNPPPPPPRRPGPPSPQRVQTSLARVRQLAKSVSPKDRPFEPGRRGTWKGSSRDLVVNGRFTVVLEDSDSGDDDIEMVTATIHGKGAARFAKEQLQSLGGSHWESDGPDFAYCVTMNQPGLVEELESAGVEVDDGQYSPPDLRPNARRQRRNGKVDPRDIPANLTPIKSWGYLSDPPESNGETRTYSNTDFGRSKADNNGWFQVDYATGSDYSGGSVQESNYRVLCEMLEKAHPDDSEPVVWARTRGGHGTYGVIVNYGDLDEDIREAIDSLEDYPLMDEEDHSNLEMEQQEEAWRDWGKKDFIKECAKHLGVDPDDFQEHAEAAGVQWHTIFHAAVEGANLNWEDQQGAGQWIDMKRAADQATDYIGGEKFSSWVDADTVEEYEKLGDVAAKLQE